MKRNCVSVWCLFLTAAALGQQTKTLTLNGRVIDSNARPVAGATVVCYKSVNKLNQLSYEPLGRARTASDGRFSLQVETESSHPYLVAGKQGLALGWRQIYSGSEPIIRLGRPKLLKGTVVDETGHPVPGARVRICLKNEMMARKEITPIVPDGWFTTRTDSKGQFLFNNVPGGATADFEVKAPGMASMWTICDFGPGEGEQYVAGRTDIRIVLLPEASIKGRVIKEETGEPVAGIRILAIPYSSAGWHFCQDPVQTDPNGRFELTGLAPNKYLLRAISDKEGTGNLTLTVEPGRTVRDVRIPLGKGVPFEVMVYNLENGATLEDAIVTVTQKNTTSRYTTFNQKVTTDANGLARLHVPPGECEIRVIKFGHGATFQPQRVQLEVGQKTRHEVSLPRTAIILSGEVLDEQGRILSGASVMRMSFGPRTLTDDNGRFDTSDTHYHSSRLPSSVRVLARHTPSGLGAIALLRDPTKSGKLHGRIILKPAYELRGRVTDPAGRSIPAAYVRLLQRRYRYLFTEVTTDANGVYCIRSVPSPGDNLKDGYAIAVCAEGFGLTQVNQIPFHDDTARPVHLDPIVLLPADEVISGVVEDSNDQPVPGALVEVYGPRLSIQLGQPPCGKTLTDAQGRFRITGVCKESLRIYARSPLPQQQSGETWAHGGNKNVRVVLGQKLIFSASLIGKPLPELKDLKIDLPPADANDKMILVCFWDMQQRPSRNCIKELAKQAQQLKQKGITVVAVQASKIDENKLNQWAKKYKIPFPVGIVQGDVEKTKFTWGIRSLPWLILIDRKHIVRAEGFNIDELDERLGQITGTEPLMENNESTGPKLRTVRFPMSRSVGRLYVGELRLLDPHWWMGWQDAGPARGDVKVPVDKALRLDVTKEGLKELSALAACKPDDIQVVSFSYADVDDAGLGHLAGLTGLKMLVSPRVGDTGLAHISKLTSLISLTLRHGTFTDDRLKYISNLSYLQRLDLGYTKVTDVGLVHLRGLSSLRYLGLDYNKSVSDAGFVHLRSLNLLERMTLYGTNITGSGFSHLEGISSLREILLNHSAITDEGLGDIAKLKSLEKLSLFNTKISDVGIVHLQALGSLRELSLSGTSVSDAGLDYIGRLTSLESLDLPDWTTDAGLLKLKGLKGLKQLDLGRTQMTGIGLELLKAFELLESLRLPRGVSDKDLAIIKEFTLLEELSIHNSPITDVGMGYLTALKSLRKLTLSNVEVTDVGYAKLGELSNLEDLTILANRNRQEYAIGDQGLAGVAKLKGLKILYLRAPNLTDAGFKHLGKLRSLQEMELKEIKITDAGFVHIGRLRSLRRLWLPSSDICDAGLRHLAELNSLQDLSFQFSGGNTAGLLHLRSLRSLTQLIVSGVTFTEDSLQHLKEISPGLRSVHIGTEGISEEDAKRIEQQVPNCSIIVFAPLSIRRPLPPKPIPPHALVGKALPKFVGINIDFGPSQARDRMILVCFWDMQQRPSRNCVRQLSKRAQELKAKDIVVVAVQSSQISENKLNEWIKKYNIPFTVGMVQDDAEKTKSTWGVRSLPWLILTDQQHIIRKEGFSLPELDEKINTITQK